MVEPDKAHMTMGRTAIACWITRATNTHLICLFSNRHLNLKSRKCNSSKQHGI